MSVLLPIFAGLVVLFWSYQRRRRSGLPPGPPGLPFIGNLFDMPMRTEWLTFERWNQLYQSDIIHLAVGGTSVIVLNTYEAATDLLDKRSSIYSSRPRMPMINELMGWDWVFILMPYGDRWRSYRKLFRRELHPTFTDRYQPHALKASQDVVQRLLDDPQNWMDHMQHFAGATIVSVAYGIDVLDSEDPYIVNAELAVRYTAEALLPGGYFVNTFPWMKYIPAWVPGAGFQQFAAEAQAMVDGIGRKPLNEVKGCMADGSFVPSVASHALETIPVECTDGERAAQEEIIFGSVGTMYLAGTSAITASLQSFVMAMILCPDVQKRAHAELDAVLGRGHMPGFDDIDELPYIGAVVKEILRWHPVTPLAVPHSSTEEDVYQGYRIPCGSMVISNVWAILHNEADYPQPYLFNPARFLNEAGQLDDIVRDPATVAFGFGRRRCAGTEMALSTLWIAIATILVNFEFGPVKDEDGNVVYPVEEYTSGMVHAPLPFACTITSRS